MKDYVAKPEKIIKKNEKKGEKTDLNAFRDGAFVNLTWGSVRT